MIFLVIGPSFCGKTHLMREWLIPTLLKSPRELTPAAPERFRGALVDDPASRQDPDGQYKGARYRDVAAWRATPDGEKTRVSCFDRADPDALVELALEYGDVVCVLDEIDLRLDSRRQLSENARRIVERGRHDGIALVGSTRRLHNVHATVRANCQLAWFGNLTEPADRQYAAHMCSVDERALVDIPPRVFLEHDRATGRVALVRLEPAGGEWQRVEVQQLAEGRA